MSDVDLETLSRIVESMSYDMEVEGTDAYLVAAVRNGKIRLRVGYAEDVKAIDLAMLHSFLSLALRDIEKKLHEIGTTGEDEKE